MEATVPTHLYILIATLVLSQIATSALAAWLWARVTAAPTHADLDGLRHDIRGTTDRVGELAETVAAQGATAEQTLASVRVIQSYLMERRP